MIDIWLSCQFINRVQDRILGKLIEFNVYKLEYIFHDVEKFLKFLSYFKSNKNEELSHVNSLNKKMEKNIK